jgi:putative aminopeptidase FrvX
MIDKNHLPGLQQQFLELLEELLQVPAPSGREEQMAALLRRHLDKLGYTHETDGSGNVLVRLEGSDPSAPLAVIAAHMDEIGVVVSHIEDDGRLCVERSGGLAPFKLGERPLVFLGDGDSIIGVPSFGTGHSTDFSRGIAWEDVRVITGLSKAQLQEKGIRPGSTGVPVTQGRGPFLLGTQENPLVAAWTMDDRAGVVVLLQLLQILKERGLQPHCPTIVAFTVHEEGGCYGAKALAQRERPEVFIAVDGSPWKPRAGIEVNDQPTCWSKDFLIHYDQRLIVQMAQVAKAAGTQLQTAVLTNASSDASAVYDCGAAGRVAIIGHTRSNSHGFEVAQLNVFPNIVNTLVELVQLEGNS